MKRLFLSSALAIFLSLVWINAVLAQGAPQAFISGNVVNGSAGGQNPQSGVVIAHFHNSEKWLEDVQTQLSPDGTFIFNDLNSRVGLSYVIEFAYQGVSYFSADADLLTQDNPPVSIIVYETTSSRDELGVGMGYIGITPVESAVHVEEDYWINNLGDRTYVELKRFENSSGILGFTLSSDATNLNINDPSFGVKELGASAAIIEAFSVLPGEPSTEITYAYDLPGRENFTFYRSYDLPVNTLQITLYSSSVGLEGTGLQFIDQSDSVGGHTSTYRMNALAIGQSFSIRFVPLTQVINQSTSYRAATLGGIILLILSAALSVGIWISKTIPPIPGQIRSMIEELAKVEARHRKKGISEKEYRRENAELRDQIRKQLKKIPDLRI